MPSPKSPSEIMEEFYQAELIDISPLSTKQYDWLRSSMRSLLEYVEESLPLYDNAAYGSHEFDKGCQYGFNKYRTDCFRKIREIKDSI